MMRDKKGTGQYILVISFFLCFMLFLLWPGVWALADGRAAETGMAINAGYTYDPADGACFSQVSVFRLYDYEDIWHHRAPDNLRFKVEGSLGAAYTDDNDTRIIANAGILALLYIDKLETREIRPYIEAGIGVIYTDYRVEGQDYRFNFNPQAGIGFEFNKGKGPKWFASLRAHHISNGGIGSKNRGQNTIVFTLGRYF